MVNRMQPVPKKKPAANGPSPKMTTGMNAPQAKVRDYDKWDAAIYRCSRCEIEYKVTRSKKPVCPMCEEIAKNQTLRDEIKKLSNANELLKRDLAMSRSQLTVLDGMREAVSELDQEDAMFLKELIYRYRASPDDVRVTQATRKRRIEVEGAGVTYRHEVNGWAVTYRDVEPQDQVTHVATSVGGAMIALQFSEALKVAGLKSAMVMLTKAMSHSMANAEGS